MNSVFKKNGATKRTRTADTLITNEALYQLSYSGSQNILKGMNKIKNLRFIHLAGLW